ncbi:MAG: alpha/beta hydrolase [Pseudomonadota bacterium]|nr:alpha/beta hydrolase [Pseudomonadota bacterium]
MTFKISTPAQTVDISMDDGAIIRVRRHSEGKQRLLFSHGNGFAIDAYYPLWRLFLASFEVVVFDVRNHGQNPRHELASHHIDRFVLDFESIYARIPEEFGVKPTVAVFHSISAITGLLQNLKYGQRWDALLAVDPPVIPEAGHALYQRAHAFELKLRDWAVRRTQQFSSPNELTQTLMNMKRLNRWQDGSHKLMAVATLVQNSTGCELACPGTYESQIYDGNAKLNIWAQLAGLKGPVRFLGADPKIEGAWPPAFVNQAIHTELGLPYSCITETTHMMQIERPQAVADELACFIHDTGIA